jgi:hypothetical protein
MARRLNAAEERYALDRQASVSCSSRMSGARAPRAVVAACRMAARQVAGRAATVAVTRGAIVGRMSCAGTARECRKKKREEAHLARQADGHDGDLDLLMAVVTAASLVPENVGGQVFLNEARAVHMSFTTTSYLLSPYL